MRAPEQAGIRPISDLNCVAWLERRSGNPDLILALEARRRGWKIDLSLEHPHSNRLTKQNTIYVSTDRSGLALLKLITEHDEDFKKLVELEELFRAIRQPLSPGEMRVSIGRMIDRVLDIDYQMDKAKRAMGLL